MDFRIDFENKAIQNHEERMSYFLKVVLPMVLDQSLMFFFVGTLCNYFFWKVASFVFLDNFDTATALFGFLIFLFSLIHAAVRGAQAYALLDFAAAGAIDSA